MCNNYAKCLSASIWNFLKRCSNVLFLCTSKNGIDYGCADCNFGNSPHPITRSYYQLLGCPREMFLLFVFIIIFYRMGTDYFCYICLKTDISSFKIITETLLSSE